MTGRGAYDGKSGSDVDACFKCQNLEREQPLVMIHCNDSIILAIHAATEKPVSGKRSLDAFFSRKFFKAGRKNRFFFSADNTAVRCVRVETENGYSR